MDSWNLGSRLPLTWDLQSSLPGAFSPSGGTRVLNVSGLVVSTALRAGFTRGQPCIVVHGPCRSHSSWAWKHLEDEKKHKEGRLEG